MRPFICFGGCPDFVFNIKNPQPVIFVTLLTPHSSLLTAHCSLLTAHCSLLTARCSLLTAHCSLLTAHCSLLTAHCSPPTANTLSHKPPKLRLDQTRAD